MFVSANFAGATNASVEPMLVVLQRRPSLLDVVLNLRRKVTVNDLEITLKIR